MAKKKNGSIKIEQQEETAVIPAVAAYPGMALMLIGFAALYLSSRANPGVFTWQSYASIGILVLGALLWFTAGMDRAQLIEWFRSAFIALFLALTIRWAIAEPYRIPSGSMEPTLHGDPAFGKGDRVFVNKFVYGLRYPFMNKRIWHGQDPQRWDLVVFKSVEPDAVHKTLVKRIVGMPGEHIQIRDGKVFSDGAPLPSPPGMDEDIYFTAPLNAPYGVQSPDNFSRIPEGHYLVLGDNSAHSRDGRYFGWLPNEHIVGRVSCIWWPPPRWRDFTGFARTLWWRALVVLVLLSIILRLFVFRLCAVQMSETTREHEHLVVSFLHYGFHLPFSKSTLFLWRKPERGDLVLYSFHDKEKEHTGLHIGRIAALPGEQALIANGSLLINDTETRLPAPAPATYVSNHREALFGRSKSKEHGLVPEHHFFILSDADYGEGPPFDSRTLGWIPEGNILGRACFCWWPPKRSGRR